MTESIWDWSGTALTNASADGNINWAEGQSPSTVNNSARAMMARVRELEDTIGAVATCGGTSTAYTLTGTGLPTTLRDGLVVVLKASAANGLAATLAVNGLAATAIKRAGAVALAANDMVTNGIYAFVTTTISGTRYWIVLNPEPIAGSTTNSGILEIATAAEFRTGTDTTRGLGVSDTWGAAAEVTLTDAATIAVDMATFLNAKVTLGGNRTLGQPTNTKVGQSGVIRIIQDGTGSRTLAYHADWKFAGGTDPVATTTAAATDLLFYQVIATNFIAASMTKGLA